MSRIRRYQVADQPLSVRDGSAAHRISVGLSWDGIVHTMSVDSEDLDFNSQRSRHEE